MQQLQPWDLRARLEPAGHLRVDVYSAADAAATLAHDVREGLSRMPKTLPPKYFYDEVGSQLFERICATPEYYPSRTEAALLELASDSIIESTRPTHIVELGSGAARKTRALLDAAERAFNVCQYVPFDVSEAMLRSSAHDLLRRYSWLSVHGVVGDYDRHLGLIPTGERRLFAFLGGTIGNFPPDDAVRFLAELRTVMGGDDQLLLGTDLVKETAVLDAAYNDAAGLTARFNRNVLRVLNRELGADFDLERFEHLAFFNERQSQVEMHLRAREAHRVRIPSLGIGATFTAGESIRTEISRKFTHSSVQSLLARAGFELADWFAPANGYFALSLARPA